MKNLQFLLAFMAAVILPHGGVAKINPALSELNPAIPLDFTKYDQPTALYCARLSELAYSKKDKIDAFFTEMKKAYPSAILQYKFIEERKGTNTQVLLWGTKDYVVVAFRGTEPGVLADWISDAKFWNYENKDEAADGIKCVSPGHGGFRTAVMKLIEDKHIMDSLSALMRICNPALLPSQFPVYLTGHSLGAALSQMFMETLNCAADSNPKRYQFKFGGAYHFAPPLAVKCDKQAMMKAKYGSLTYDIVNYLDYVPRAGRNATAHFGQFYRICTDGAIYKEAERYIKFRKLNFEFWTELKLHPIGAYIAAVGKADNSAAKVTARSTANDCGCMCKKRAYKVALCP